MTREFNAINGLEVLDLLLLDLREQLQNDALFRGSTTYPILRYKVDITLEAYPVEPPVQTTTATGALVNLGVGSPAATPVESTAAVSGEVEFPEEVRATKLSKAKKTT